MNGRRIKIVGGGQGRVYRHWHVVDADSGEPIVGVRRIELVADARGVGEAILYIGEMGVELEIDDVQAAERAEELSAAERVAAEVERRLRSLLQTLIGRDTRL